MCKIIAPAGHSGQTENFFSSAQSLMNFLQWKRPSA